AGDAPGAAVAELAFVLRERRASLVRAVLAVPVRLGVLGRGERVSALALRPPREEHLLGAVAARGPLRGEPAAGETELVVGAPGDGEVALMRIEGPLEHPDRLDGLGQNEVGVGVAVTVEVPRIVDRYAADGDLHRLAFSGVEAAESDGVGVPFAALVGHQNAGRELQEVSGARARDHGELADRELEVGAAPGRRSRASGHAHLAH